MYKAIILILFISSFISAQTFEPVEVGPVVEDGGDSRAVNWIDYDNDGDLDLFITNGPRNGQNNFFYENNGDGTFTKITDIAIVLDNSASDGSTWGDIDNDGDLDLYVANWWGQSNKFYLNNGDKTFTEITGELINASNSYSETASWGDFNNDGYLDLLVANSDGNRRNLLFQNNGDNTFTKISSGNVVTDAHYTRDVDWVDINGDGLQDIYVTNESGQNNALYINNGDGTFEKVTDINIVQDSKSSWSSNWIDYDNDGDFDLFFTNWNGQNNSLYQNNGDGTFTQITDGDIVNDGGHSSGSDWGDIDNDGDLDLYVGNAFASTETNNFMYINNGDGTFTKVENEVTDVGGWTYGVSFGDLNRDGYLDLAIAKCYSATENNALFINTTGNSNNWIIIRLDADSDAQLNNRVGIGAIVRIKTNIDGKNVWQARRIEGQNGYCAQNLEAHFGLGKASSIDSVIVEWPSGLIQVYDNVELNSVNSLKEDIDLSVEDDRSVQNDFTLFQNYPNPFNPTTTISYNLSKAGNVKIVVYDLLGNKVTELVNQYSSPGLYSVLWKGNTSTGETVSSGVYFYSMYFGELKSSKKMFLVK
ncbi:MAG: FG-GAP-like repeat-containing protein [Melioribacteraceae bacterium]|nr:FG-GAP-like repeat-containing protein [Melioribacteraceae bacterium]